MLDTNLVNKVVDLKDYRVARPDELPCLFLGFLINNEYDNQRLKLNEEYNPIKMQYAYESEGRWLLCGLYGLFLPLNKLGKEIHKRLLEQGKQQGMDLETYKDFISKYNLSCDNCEYVFNKRVFPVDFKHFKKLTDNEIVEDKKILQHLLSMDENEFAFEQFGAFKVIMLS